MLFLKGNLIWKPKVKTGKKLKLFHLKWVMSLKSCLFVSSKSSYEVSWMPWGSMEHSLKLLFYAETVSEELIMVIMITLIMRITYCSTV